MQNAVVSGHGKGGLISNYISSKGDNLVTLDAAQTIGNKSQSKSKNYRSNGDIVSLLDANKHNTINLSNPNKQTGNIVHDVLNAHDVKNIKKEKLFV